MNTRMTYLYRDASNYKQGNEVVLAGTITEEQKKIIAKALFDFDVRHQIGYFIPAQIGLPEVRFEEVTENDYCFFELCMNKDFSETGYVPTVEMTVEDVTRAIAKAGNDGWDYVRFALVLD